MGRARYRVLTGILASICLVVAVVACAPQDTPPSGEVPTITSDVSVLVGSQTTTAVDIPGVVSIGSVQVTDPTGLVVDAYPASASASDVATVAFHISALLSTDPGPHDISAELRGCATDVEDECPSGSTRRFRVRLSVDVTVGVVPGPGDDLEAVVEPSADRIALAEPIDPDVPEWRRLTDELLVQIGSADDPGDFAAATSLAAQVDATVIGGISELGFYQLRFDSEASQLTGKALLETEPNVVVSPATIGEVGLDAKPDDLDDDRSDGTWQWDVINAYSAWDRVTGTGIRVGIVDNGVLSSHEDLDVVHNSSDPIVPYTGDDRGEESHGTHVAGLACAAQNGLGVVGAAWGCQVVAAQALGPNKVGSVAAVIAAMWDVLSENPKVVNMSLGLRLNVGACPDQDVADRAAAAWLESSAPRYRSVFESEKGRRTLWTVSAGNNCVDGNQGVGQLAAEYPHVISVAAVNSDSKLAAFSNTTAEVAAPGGVGVGEAGDGTTGVWSTGLACTTSRCRGSYQPMSGTSMAAPIVAGVAALVFDAHPGITPDHVAECITKNGNDVKGYSDLPTQNNLPVRLGQAPAIPVLDAVAALDCRNVDLYSAIDTGFFNTCAVRVDHRVACWGGNDWGTLGDGSTWSSARPVEVTGIDDALDIRVGFFQACALRTGGKVSCWGGNGYGEVGDGTWETRTEPIEVYLPSSMGQVTRIAAGYSSTCAVGSDGSVWCWGGNNSGELGDGTYDDSPLPVQVTGLPPVREVAIGGSFACARTVGLEVWCWGNNGSGQLGVSTEDTQRNTAAPVPGLSGVYSIDVGDDHACSVLLSGAVRCWGANDHGKLGDGTYEPSQVPVTVAGIDPQLSPQAVTGGYYHTCVIAVGPRRGGLCWGANYVGQTGDGVGTTLDGTAYADRITPAPVALDGPVRDVRAGFSHSCAIGIDYRAYCWGDNTWGQVGDGTYETRFAPVQVSSR